MGQQEIWPDESGFHKEYPLILSGAHRRRLTPLGAPALLRHLAFWNATPPDLEEDSGLDQNGSDKRTNGNDPTQVEQRAMAADRCLAKIYLRLLQRQQPAESAVVSGLTVPDALDNWIVLFAGIIDRETGASGDDENIRAERILTDSYRAIKFHFRWHGIATKLSFELHSEYLTLTAILDMSEGSPESEGEGGEIFNEICRTLTEVCDSPETAAAESASQWRQQLYDEIWNQFSKDILNCLKDMKPLLGEAFVDFRGLVVRPRPQRRFSLPLRGLRSPGGPAAETESRCCPTHLARIWPLIKGFGDDSTEFTVSWFLNKRAVYATALGSQASLLTEGPPQPLHYFLYEDTLSPWQLGRLIYRIHRAGTARLAAIIHFGKLRTANEILAEIETTLEEEIVRLSKPNDENEDGSPLRDDLRRLYDRIDVSLGAISALGLENSLESRVERSRYYVDQFKTTVRALRIERVEGFQTYDEFVEQRLNPMFDYIDRLGRRVARIQQDRLLLIGRIQSLEALHETYLISIAQRLADIGLSCVLGPYYGAYIAAHALSGLVPERAVWLGAAFFGAIMLKVILWRDGAKEQEERLRQDARENSDSAVPALPAWEKRLFAFASRRLRLYITVGVLTLVLGAGVHFVLFGLGWPPQHQEVVMAPSHPLATSSSPEIPTTSNMKQPPAKPPAPARSPSPPASPSKTDTRMPRQ